MSKNKAKREKEGKRQDYVAEITSSLLLCGLSSLPHTRHMHIYVYALFLFSLSFSLIQYT